jgi:hypothetical protein
MMKPMLQPNGLEQLDGTTLTLRRWDIGFKHGNLHILQGGEGRQQMKCLKNESNLVCTIVLPHQ